MLVKVCGMVDSEQIKSLEGVTDLTGFIFYSKSPRFHSDQKIKNVPFKVGVFVNETKENILEKIQQFELQYIQLHGNEKPEECLFFKSHCMVIKAFGIDHEFDFKQLKAYNNTVDYFLFDTKCINYGGSGKSFNWKILKHYNLDIPFFLGGGINPESIESLQNFDHPKWIGIDLNSGFESAPGNKNIEQLKIFIHEFRKTTLHTTR